MYSIATWLGVAYLVRTYATSTQFTVFMITSIVESIIKIIARYYDED